MIIQSLLNVKCLNANWIPVYAMHALVALFMSLQSFYAEQYVVKNETSVSSRSSVRVMR